MKEYAFDLRLKAAIRVKAASLADAIKALQAELDCAEANFGAWPDGSPIIGEVSLAAIPTGDDLFEIDGDSDVCVCPDCAAVEGEPEWGTVGDGFDGYCPSCADAREASGEVETG